jgi:glyoxylase-like metal-dependent hydrolase (beta-lactamase superfamily II)
VSALIRLVRVTDEIYVATSRRYETNSTVILDGHGGALVVDPSWDADELAAIPEDLRTLGVRCVAGLSTHMHYDHVLWHPELGEVPRWASAGTVEAVTTRRAELLEPLVGDIPDDLISIAGHLVPIAGHELDWQGPPAVIHQHDAHAPHHIAVEIPALGLLIAGDMLSDIELPMPDSDDQTLATYRSGLTSLADVVHRVDLLIPGHGTVGRDARGRYEQDLAYLDDLDGSGTSPDPRILLEGNAELHAENVGRSAYVGDV